MRGRFGRRRAGLRPNMMMPPMARRRRRFHPFGFIPALIVLGIIIYFLSR